MRYEYDSVADALYVTLRDEPPQRQVRLEDGTIVDIGSDDAVVGIEVLVPSGDWDPGLVAERWRLDVHERDLLDALSESFRTGPTCSDPRRTRRLVGYDGPAGGGKQVPSLVRQAA